MRDEERTLRIAALAAGGEGVARSAGEPVTFVAGTVPGDLVRVALVEESRRHRRARLLEVVEPGPARRGPPCPETHACGGCAWMHVGDAAQDEAARATVVDALRRIGGFPAAEELVAPAAALGARLAYRQRVRLHLDLDGPEPRAGFLGAGTHAVHEPAACHVLEPALERARCRLAAGARALARALGGGRAQLQVDMPRDDAAAAELVVEGRPGSARLARALDVLRAAAPELVALRARDATGATAVLGEPRVRHARGPLEEPARWPAWLSPGGFLQAGREGNRLLVSRVLEAVRALGLPEGARVLELHAGDGNLTLPLAGLGLRVDASDVVADAVENGALAAAECAASLAHVPSFVVDEAARRVRWAGGGWDLVVLDPPRTGDRDAAAAIAAARPGAVVHVSCDAATLARDLRVLAAAGLRLVRVEPLALFPQTPHVEIVAVLVRERAP